MKILNLTSKETFFDLMLRHIAKQANKMDMQDWVNWFTINVIIRNSKILPNVLSIVKHKNDMTKMYLEFKNAAL